MCDCEHVLWPNVGQRTYFVGGGGGGAEKHLKKFRVFWIKLCPQHTQVEYVPNFVTNFCILKDSNFT
jgi:hypothetical protein